MSELVAVVALLVLWILEWFRSAGSYYSDPVPGWSAALRSNNVGWAISEEELGSLEVEESPN